MSSSEPAPNVSDSNPSLVVMPAQSSTVSSDIVLKVIAALVTLGTVFGGATLVVVDRTEAAVAKGVEPVKDQHEADIERIEKRFDKIDGKLDRIHDAVKQ